MSEEEKTIPELISEITEFNEISDFLSDEDVDQAMATIIRLIAKPNVPASTAAPLIVQLQALSAKFDLMAKYHMLYTPTIKEDKTKSQKKNTFMTLSDQLEKLANAVKYLVKN